MQCTAPDHKVPSQTTKMHSVFNCCSSFQPFKNRCPASLWLLTELTRLFNLIQTSPDLPHNCFEYSPGDSTLSCSPGKSLLSLLVYIWTTHPPPPTRPLPLYGPIDLHQSVRSRTEETDRNTQAGFCGFSCLWLRSNLTPYKRLCIDKMLQDSRGAVGLRTVCTDAESSVEPKRAFS